MKYWGKRKNHVATGDCVLCCVLCGGCGGGGGGGGGVFSFF